VVHAWVLARSDRTGSWNCFQNALDSDIADVQGGTTPEGIHLGAMTGTLDLVHRCYLGIETRDNVLPLDPSLPREVESLGVVLHYRRHKLEVEATRTAITVRSQPLTAPPITVAYRGRDHELSPGLSLNFDLVVGHRAASDQCPEGR
jgi:alpha,alpha-trehalase